MARPRPVAVAAAAAVVAVLAAVGASPALAGPVDSAERAPGATSTARTATAGDLPGDATNTTNTTNATDTGGVGVVENATNATENVTDNATDTVDDAVDNTTNATDNATDTVDDAADNATNTTENVTENATDTVDDAADNATNATDNATDTVDGVVANATGNATENASGAVDDVVDNATNATENASGAVGGVVERASGATDAVGGVVARARDAVGEARDAVEAVENPLSADVDAGTVLGAVTGLAGSVADVLDAHPDLEALLGGTEAGESTGGADAGRSDGGAGGEAAGGSPGGERDGGNAPEVAEAPGSGSWHGSVPAPGSPVGVGLGVGAVVAAGAAAKFAGATPPAASGAGGIGRATAEYARLQLSGLRDRLRWLGVLAYSRWDDSDPLEHETRAALYERVRSEPGVSLSALGDATAASLSSVRHHLRVLEHEGLVESERRHGRRRYTPAGDAEANAALSAALSEEAPAAVLEAMHGLGPASTSELAEAVDRDPSTVSHHLSRLEADGLVVRERDGRSKLARLAPEAETALTAGAHATAEGEATPERAGLD